VNISLCVFKRLFLVSPSFAAAAAAAGVVLTGAAAAGGPDDNQQLLMLRLAAAAGRTEAVALLLAEFGGQQGSPRCETCLRAVLRGAVHAGQVALLQVRHATFKFMCCCFAKTAVLCVDICMKMCA
jgi:hypothetical protein